MAAATQRQWPSGSGRWRPALPLTVTNLPAFLSRYRCSITSGNVTATMHTATAAIRWYDGVPSLLVSLYRYVASTRWPSGSPSTSGSPKISKPRKKTSTPENRSEGVTIGRLTSRATRKGEAPAMRAASSTSEPRLFSADDE